MAKVEPHPDGGYLYRFGTRRVKAAPATPWGIFAAEVREVIEPNQAWVGCLSTVMAIAKEGHTWAAYQAKRKRLQKAWASTEAFLIDWARARRWLVEIDQPRDLITIRMNPKKLPPKAEKPRPAVDQPALPGLFD